jgi:hypothetical protein
MRDVASSFFLLLFNFFRQHGCKIVDFSTKAYICAVRYLWELRGKSVDAAHAWVVDRVVAGAAANVASVGSATVPGKRKCHVCS